MAPNTMNVFVQSQSPQVCLNRPPLRRTLALLAVWSCCFACSGGPLSRWRQRANTDAGPIAFGAGTFVSAGADGLILVSTNGQSWSAVDSKTTNHFSRAAYLGNQFVCVGNYGTIVTSPDGQTWTKRDSGTSNWLASVAYGNSQWVAVGGSLIGDAETQVVATSVDGVRWQVREQPGTVLSWIVFGNERFVAVPAFDGSLLTSTDAEHWQTNRVSCTSGYAHEVIYAGNQFVAVGTCYDQPAGRSPIIATSSDGLTWTERSANAPGYGLGPIAYGAGLYVVAGSIPGYIVIDWITGQQTWIPDVPLLLTSTDAVLWHKEETFGLPAFYELAYGRETFVATGDRRTFQTDVMLPRFGPVARLNSQGFEGEIVADVGERSRVQVSTNLANWTDMMDVTNTAAYTSFLDRSATNPVPQRYYRLSRDE
jgi:hypothetical protein